MKYRVQSICGATSWTPTSSDSVELLVLIFCFFEIPVMDPVPIDMVAPVCPLQSP
jgi:hypothetical protein